MAPYTLFLAVTLVFLSIRKIVTFVLAFLTNKSPIILNCMPPNFVGHVLSVYVVVAFRHVAKYGSVFDFVNTVVASTMLVWAAFVTNCRPMVCHQ